MDERHSIEVPRTARFHLRAADGGPARSAWFVLHGYGQLAAPFLAELAPLARPGRLLVAPEGLSRFYLRRGTGSVGASWMTREERADEIRDTVRYLDRVWERVRVLRARPEGDRPQVLGFSQGGAAAARWALLGETPLGQVVSWGCALPPDLDLRALAGRARALRWTFVLGDQDASLDREAFAAGLERLRAVGAEAERLDYAGGHALDPATLGRLGG